MYRLHTKKKRRRTDRVDSRKLARELSVSHLEGIYVPSPESEAIRSFSRLRIQLTKDQTRMKNRIISLLYFSGVDIAENDEIRHWSGKFIKYLSEIEFEYKAKKSTLNYLVEVLKQNREQLVKVIRELRILVKEQETVKKIMGHLLSCTGNRFYNGNNIIYGTNGYKTLW